MKKEDKQLAFWIVGFILVCYCEGLDQGTGSSVHLNDNGGIRIEEEKRLKRDSGKIQFECIKPKNAYIESVRGVTVGQCVEHCWKVRKDWALLKQRDRCACITNNDQYTVVPNSQCNKGCQNAKKQNCGALRLWSKYKTGYIKEPTFNKASKHQLHSLHLGCSRLKKELIGEPKLITQRMHVRMCLEFCEYHKKYFAALHNGDTCQCAVQTTHYFTYTKSKCLQPCWGQMDLRCGGREKDIYTVYKTDTKNFRQMLDDRFEDLSWKKSARKDSREYEFFSDTNSEVKDVTHNNKDKTRNSNKDTNKNTGTTDEEQKRKKKRCKKKKQDRDN